MKLINRIQDLIVEKLTLDSLTQTFGFSARQHVEAQKRPIFVALVEKMLPDLKVIADEEVGEVQERLTEALNASARAQACAQSAEANANYAENKMLELQGAVNSAKSQAAVANKLADESAAALKETQARFAAVVAR